MIIDKESLQKAVDKHLNPLENKINDLSKETVLREIENLPLKRDSRYSPYVEERYNEGKFAVKEYLKGNLKEFGSAENDEYKVVILGNFKMLYIKKDDLYHYVPVGSWMDWWEYDHERYFGVTEKYYKLLPLNKRAELEAKLQLKLWIDREYYSSYAEFYLPQEYDKWWWDEDGASKQIKDFNYGNEYWKQRLQKPKSQSIHLTGNDIFDITTTGMSFYDSMLHKEHIAGNRDPVEYFKTNKGLVFEIVYMSPQEYLEESYKIHKKFSSDYGVNQIPFETYLKTIIDPDRINEYTERTLEGSKMPMPVLDYDKLTQEGRHRTVVAMELGIEEIPVLVVRTYEE